MTMVRLPDGSSRALDAGATGNDLAAAIGPGLAKSAVAVKQDGQIRDLASLLSDGSSVAILTKKDPEALDVLRHSAAHLMADAILRVFPKAQLTIGPAVEDGFYYDIFLPEGERISVEDFPKIEGEMQRVAKQSLPFVRCVAHDETDEVYARYRAIDGGHNKFKAELVEGIKQRGEELSFYKHGDFVDLCRGPHVPHTGWLLHTKLTKLSGSYWRADASREHLVRVYGTAFFSKQDLEAYLHQLEEAKRRDHRVLGEQLDLFIQNDDAPGFPFFLPKGATLFNLLVDYMRGLLRRRDYQEVKTPLVLSERLWHTSGHYDHYLENMFFTKLKLRDEKHPEQVRDNVEEERPMAVKPMNCPGHLLIYRARLHSHNELPLRIAEMGLVHRRELSGVRHGLFRVQAFTQDDAHHFCTPDQIESEIRMLIAFFREVYATFDLDDVRIELSTRPAKSIGSDEIWQEAEAALKAALDASGIEYQVNPGDGAFYGPKIDFHIRDVLRRSWQCGTIQLDFSMPERFGLEYVGADGARHTPVMLHRACYGSVERFLGIIIENYAGTFPLWLAPVQVSVVPISDKFTEYATRVSAELQDRGLRVQTNLGSDRVAYKVREASLQRIPYVAVVGQKEEAASTISVRSHVAGEIGAMTLGSFLSAIADELRPGGKPGFPPSNTSSESQ